MNEVSIHRVLFCIGVNQNFMDAPQQEMVEVWQSFSAMMKDISGHPDITILGIMDDDRIQVGPSTSSPWTAYIMADVANIEAVISACDFFRSTPVGDGTFKLWKYCKVEARIGRELVVPN